MYFKIDTGHEIKLGLFNILHPPQKKKQSKNEKTATKKIQKAQ